MITAVAPPVRGRLGLAVFLLLAFGVPWSGWIALRFAESPSDIFETVAFIWCPAAVSIAGFVAAFADGGWPGLRAFVARVLGWRFPPWLLLVAAGAPLLAGLLSFASHPADLLHGGGPAWLQLLAPFSLANLWTGPLAEEFGWRGYLLPRVGRRLPPLAAGLVIGPIWALWHLPLFYDGPFAHVGSALSYVAWVTSWSVVMALVVTRSGGGVLPSILIHLLINIDPSLFGALLPRLPHDHMPGGLSFSLASVMVAAGLVWTWRNGIRRAAPQTES